MKSKYSCALLLLCCLSSIQSLLPQDTIKELEDEELINISYYPYPKETDTDAYRIAILGSNDLHGKIFPTTYTNLLTDETYESGGGEFIGSYLNILRKEWDKRLLWFDAGDQFQGGMEFFLSNGTIMNDFYNTKTVDAITLGNHEFDFGFGELTKKMEKSQFTYVSANLFSKKTSKYEFLPNLKRTKLFVLEKVTIGVIGLSTKETLYKSATDFSDVEFQDYAKVVLEQAKDLRNQGANAVILLSHFGAFCTEDKETTFTLQMWTKDSKHSQCDPNTELQVLLDAIGEGIIDAVVAGHRHNMNHHFINGIPVIQTPNSASYSNIIYLAFDANNNYKLLPDKISIEGPLPLCPKVFENTKRCNYLLKDDIAKAGQLKEFIFHENQFKRDDELTDVLSHWREELKKKDIEIAYSEAILSIKDNEETTLTNMMTDICRRVTGADISLYNLGGFRINWFPGRLTEVDMYNMFPFPAYLTTFEMTGEEVIKMMTMIQNDIKISPTSGLVQTFMHYDSKFHLIKAKLFDGINEKPIDIKATYVICTNDFLANGNSIFKQVAQWYKLRNQKKYGQIINYVTSYVRSIKRIKEEMFIDKTHPRIRIIKQ